ncbi:MAG: hypothetical protein II816_02760, partial [Elusimicrobia bacterium]|nr:hypothetical protein [Elusimicrobiota bacterium]
EDVKDEWTQLLNEQKIEDLISAEMKLTIEDKQAIDDYIGRRIVFADENETEQELCESDVLGVLGYDCFPRRTKANKKALGSDGLIEYISQIKEISCERVYCKIQKKFVIF